MGNDQQQDYFCDGMTEDIITHLSKIADLHVISRTSAMQYKGTKKTAREIGKELNVAVILEGSVRREGNNAMIRLKKKPHGSCSRVTKSITY